RQPRLRPDRIPNRSPQPAESSAYRNPIKIRRADKKRRAPFQRISERQERIHHRPLSQESSHGTTSRKRRRSLEKSSKMLDNHSLGVVYCLRDRRTDPAYGYQGPPGHSNGGIDSFCPAPQKVYPNLLFSTLFYIIVVRPTALEGPSLICDSTAVVPA